MLDSSVKNQILTAFVVNILSILHGGACGWPSSSVLLLTSDLSPLKYGKISIEEASWISALLCIGGFFGNLFYGWLANIYGRKYPLLSIAIPSTIGWLLTAFAQHPFYLYAARILLGVCSGGIFVFVPLFITEVSDDRVRGFLGSFLVLFCNIGILTAYVLGNYFDYIVMPLIMAGLSMLFFILFLFFPETPQYLTKTGKDSAAENSLRYYKNIRRQSSHQEDELLKAEISKYKNSHRQQNSEELSSLTFKDFNYPAAKKAFIIGIGLIMLNQLNGAFAMLTYTATIFEESGSNLTPNMSAIVIGTIQLLGAYISTNLVEKAGRKLLISGSAFGIFIGLIGLATYIYLKSIGINVSPYGWIPIVCFSFSIFIASFGVLNLPFMVISEIMPEKIRGYGATTCMSILWILAFVMLKYFPIISTLYGMHTCFYFFAAFSLVGSVFVYTVMPETKGKSFDEILQKLGGNGT